MKGRVVIDAFRSINPYNMMMNSEPRISTSNVGLMKKPSLEARIRGLNKLFYSMVISSRTNDSLEINMLQNLHKLPWNEGLKKSLTFDKEE